MSGQVDTRRVEMYQLFKDFDRSTAYTRVVTPSQFGRILATLRVAVDPEDHRLLCRKFAVDPGSTGDINYPAFVQCVDRVFVNYTVDRLKQYDCAPACPKVYTLITVCVSRRRRKMYCGHARMCVCLSAAVRPHYCMDPDVTWEHGRGCPLLCTIGRICNRGTGCVAMTT